MSRTANDDLPVDEDGLTAAERMYLGTPFSKMSPDERMTAIAIHEKKCAKIYSTNAEIRKAEEAKRKAELTGSKQRKEESVRGRTAA